MARHGSTGYFVFFALCELCAEKIKPPSVDPTIHVTLEFLKRTMRIYHVAKLKSVLKTLAHLNLISMRSRTDLDAISMRSRTDLEPISENLITISIPKLLLRLDNHTKNLQATYKQLAPKSKKKIKNKIKIKEKEIERHTPDATTAARVPPTPELVADYFVTRWPEARHEAATFFDYYSANGWRTRHGPLRDWQAAARNWMRRRPAFAASATHEPRPKPFPNIVLPTPDPHRVGEPA